MTQPRNSAACPVPRSRRYGTVVARQREARDRSLTGAAPPQQIHSPADRTHRCPPPTARRRRSDRTAMTLPATEPSPEEPGPEEPPPEERTPATAVASADVPLVTILVPTYQRAATLQRAVDSALAQDHPRIE